MEALEGRGVGVRYAGLCDRVDYIHNYLTFITVLGRAIAKLNRNASQQEHFMEQSINVVGRCQTNILSLLRK